MKVSRKNYQFNNNININQSKVIIFQKYKNKKYNNNKINNNYK